MVSPGDEASSRRGHTETSTAHTDSVAVQDTTVSLPGKSVKLSPGLGPWHADDGVADVSEDVASGQNGNSPE
jgi:hypothetical protein